MAATRLMESAKWEAAFRSVAGACDELARREALRHAKRELAIFI